MSPLVVVVALLLALPLYDVVRRPGFRRLALRNSVRRPSETALVVLGAMLGTAIITAAFVVSDTLDASIRDVARTHQGPVDEAVGVESAEHVLPAMGAITETPLPDTDGVILHTKAAATAATVAEGADRRAEPDAALSELDFAAARRFGADQSITGFADAGATPAGGEAVIGEDLADELEIGRGDRIEVFAYGTTRQLTVRGTVPRLGLAGWPASSGAEAPVVFVAPGTIAAMASEGKAPGASPPGNEILVSNEGGVFDSTVHSAAVKAELERRLEGIPGTSVQDPKVDVLEEADDQAASVRQLYTGIGQFSVVAGILLLVNIFVMLADERRTEMGVLRAVGLKRNHLVRSFAMEGAAYSIMAAVVGVLAGIGVGWIIVQVTAVILANEEGVGPTVFAATGPSLVRGGLTGLVISLVTAWLTSASVARLNIIQAIRDLPRARAARQRVWPLFVAAAGVLLGIAVGMSGISAGGSAVAAMSGFPIAAFSAIPLLSRLLPRRVVLSVASGLALLWATVGVSWFADSLSQAEITVFVVEGVILVAAGVVLVVANDTIWIRVADRLSRGGRGMAARLGLAYPLDRRFRTGLILAMYAIVIFTMTFISVFVEVFRDQAPTLARESALGFDLLVETNGSNPATVEQLSAQPGVTKVAPVRQTFAEFETSWTDTPEWWAISGFDLQLVSEGGLVVRDVAPGVTSPVDLVLSDPSWALVPDFFLQRNGPPRDLLTGGDTITLVDPGTDKRHVLKVAALVENDFSFNGVLVQDAFLKEFLGPQAVQRRAFVSVDPQADAEEVADTINGALVPNGAKAETFRSIVNEQMTVQIGFFNLMQGYLGLGLLIGIAGLGVVMIRAVRERRREVGMLRAMGFPSSVVRRAFLLEAAFISVQGIFLGVGLALFTAQQVMNNSDAFGNDLSYQVPWVALVLLFVVPLLASLAATSAPAMQAARIRPAVALRIAD